jgi:hypothetical protein
MLKKALELGSCFDWITPLVAYWKDWTNAPAHTFVIPEACDWSALEIQRMLKQHGIKTWGLMIVKESIMISMRLAQAHWAQYLLQQEQIPIEYGLLEDRHAGATEVGARVSRPVHAMASPPRGVWARLAQVIDDLADEIKGLFRF